MEQHQARWHGKYLGRAQRQPEGQDRQARDDGDGSGGGNGGHLPAAQQQREHRPGGAGCHQQQITAPGARVIAHHAIPTNHQHPHHHGTERQRPALRGPFLQQGYGQDRADNRRRHGRNGAAMRCRRIDQRHQEQHQIGRTTKQRQQQDALEPKPQQRRPRRPGKGQQRHHANTVAKRRQIKAAEAAIRQHGSRHHRMAAPDQGGGKAKGQSQNEFRVHRPPLHPGAFLSHEKSFTSAVNTIK